MLDFYSLERQRDIFKVLLISPPSHRGCPMGGPRWAGGSCPSAEPVLCLWDLSSSRAECPCPFGRGAARPPFPGRENCLSCLSFVLEGSLQIFPFLSAYGALPRAVPGLSRVMPVGCAMGAPTGSASGSSLLPLCSLSSSPGFLQRIECGAFKSIFAAEYILHSL